ncbi:tyrosine-protein phosphatase [Heyndrickxia sporothermodurans]|uniref:tyrosine-protein phosphatase n=1 Tax=Heyndrickxia sporothermodurans TaxID=46224 RepID=UPI002E1EEAB8|nr:CpsB/CapC family capsule biosynthesis tyrosine phosphatase [Heyndrickxia sporothermodurans]MED3652382.1 tyrosine protein phosphatase [Heyndrickxia sporothermodurans]MED3696912.1 tyrosine protein phosphatase [Heyndrickxia sporothermodurans]
MIDIHCHILPGIDDGAQNVTDSIAMAKKAVSEGIHTIIATPHHKNGKYNNRKVEIIDQVKELNKELKKAEIELTILPGQENRIFGEIIQDYHEGEILTLTGQSNYLFIEFPSGHVPRYSKQLLYDIQLQGLTPIIVHPERNSELIENPNQLYEFVKNGAATQITAASLTGHFGKKIKKFTEQLIEANLTHFIASDAHNVTNRSFKMNEALDVIEQKYGVNSVYYFTENADLLVDGKHIIRDVPEPIKTKKFFGLF